MAWAVDEKRELGSGREGWESSVSPCETMPLYNKM